MLQELDAEPLTLNPKLVVAGIGRFDARSKGGRIRRVSRNQIKSKQIKTTHIEFITARSIHGLCEIALCLPTTIFRVYLAASNISLAATFLF
jgi:hypothetical protein